ncbi:MAG: hypothetical protein Q8T13_04885 [Acidobacteriota bacterium]|nr:hypothetical protein [Acidobacteriota bacterium]
MRFHRFLEGRKSLMPQEWVVSRIAEEFHLPPSLAVRELRRHRDLVLRVMELRAYADAFHLVRDSKGEDSLPPEGANPMVDLVFELQLRAMRSRGGRNRD